MNNLNIYKKTFKEIPISGVEETSEIQGLIHWYLDQQVEVEWFRKYMFVCAFTDPFGEIITIIKQHEFFHHQICMLYKKSKLAIAGDWLVDFQEHPARIYRPITAPLQLLSTKSSRVDLLVDPPYIPDICIKYFPQYLKNEIYLFIATTNERDKVEKSDDFTYLIKRT